jgi:hypothetical protein
MVSGRAVKMWRILGACRCSQKQDALNLVLSREELRVPILWCRCLIAQKRSKDFARLFGPCTPVRTWGTRPIPGWFCFGADSALGRHGRQGILDGRSLADFNCVAPEAVEF